MLSFFGRTHNKSNEKEIIDNIDKVLFFKWMDSCGFDKDRLCDIFDSRKISGHEQDKFNQALRNAKDKVNISLINSVLYLEEYAVQLNKLLSILDNETMFVLKKELSEKYKIELDINSLSEILGD